MGTVIDPVPVTGLAANFSPIPLIAPPPLGRDIAGGAGAPAEVEVAEEFFSELPSIIHTLQLLIRSIVTNFDTRTSCLTNNI
jgi:hypothetical protein